MEKPTPTASQIVAAAQEIESDTSDSSIAGRYQVNSVDLCLLGIPILLLIIFNYTVNNLFMIIFNF
jgi:hypothetical protein